MNLGRNVEAADVAASPKSRVFSDIPRSAQPKLSMWERFREGAASAVCVVRSLFNRKLEPAPASAPRMTAASARAVSVAPDIERQRLAGIVATGAHPMLGS